MARPLQISSVSRECIQEELKLLLTILNASQYGCKIIIRMTLRRASWGEKHTSGGTTAQGYLFFACIE